MQRDYEFAEERQREQTAVARIVVTPGGLRFALPVHTTLEIVEQPQPWRVPGAAAHALGLLSWQGRRIPFVDADAVLTGSACGPVTRFALILAWQRSAGGAIEHGAIAIDALPQSVEVADAVQCPVPDFIPGALSCFMHEGHAIPILDSAQLFSAARPPTIPSPSP